MKKRIKKARQESYASTRAAKLAKDHAKTMEGKRVILVPHPTIPKTLIEKII